MRCKCRDRPADGRGTDSDHLAEVEVIAAAKLSSGAVEPDGSITIADEDLERHRD